MSSRFLSSLRNAGITAIATCASVLAMSFQVASGQSPQSMACANRTSGVAPLAVNFDAVAASSGVVQPASGTSPNSMTYSWDFGDPGGGQWPIAQKPRNRAIGYIAAHVYETPGTYVANLRVVQPNGSESVYQQWIDVQDPEVVYAGRTYYVSSAGNDANSGTSQSQPFRTINHAWSVLMGSNGPRRLLLRRGDTFTAGSGLSAGTRNGPYTVATYGVGIRPRVLVTHGGDAIGVNNVNDLRIIDTDFIGPYPAGTAGNGWLMGSNSLMQRCMLRGFSHAVGCYYGTNHDGNTLFECSLLDNQNYGLYSIGISRLAVLGNHFDNSVNNSLLRVYSSKTVISANFFQRAGQGAIRTLGRSLPDRAEYVVFTDNFVMSNTPWVYNLGPENATAGQHLRHAMVERNQFYNRGASAIVLVFAEEVAVRNNVFDLGGAQAVQVNQWGVGPVPRGVVIDNNTAYQNSSGTLRFANVASADTTPVRNNIVFNAGGAEQVASGSVWSTNNYTADPSFLAVWCGDMRVNAWSGAVAGGLNGVVRQDLLGNPRHSGSTDIGAYERW